MTTLGIQLPGLTSVDISAWFRFSQSIESMMVINRKIQIQFITQVAQAFRTEIQDQVLEGNTYATGTYHDSVKVIPVGTELKPEVRLILDPTGGGAARFPIYWLVLEFGSAPIPDVPHQAIHEWGKQKFGMSWKSSGRIADRIRERGIAPNPILQRVFILQEPEGIPIGLTSKATEIYESIAQRFMNRMIQSYNQINKLGITQRRLSGGQPGGGQFTFKQD